MLILDTCAILWLADDQHALSPAARSAITKHAGAIYVSAITAFEIALKVRKKRLELPMPPDRWYQKALELHGLVEIPIAGKDAVTAAHLPLIHNDPCDRFILATALNRNLAIITADAVFATYPGANVIW